MEAAAAPPTLAVLHQDQPQQAKDPETGRLKLLTDKANPKNDEILPVYFLTSAFRIQFTGPGSHHFKPDSYR
jgi:hypothetical protein